MRINQEYESVKKRALVNYLTNEKLNLEAHFHTRTLNMLKAISNYEQQNLRTHLKDIVLGSFDTVQKALSDPSQKKEIQSLSFKSALLGISSGAMKYENDPLLPMLQNEMQKRIAHFKGLTPEEEGKLLSLTAEQRRVIADLDRKAKEDYLHHQHNLNLPGLKK